jgi:hypothetical protein
MLGMEPVLLACRASALLSYTPIPFRSIYKDFKDKHLTLTFSPYFLWVIQNKIFKNILTVTFWFSSKSKMHKTCDFKSSSFSFEVEIPGCFLMQWSWIRKHSGMYKNGITINREQRRAMERAGSAPCVSSWLWARNEHLSLIRQRRGEKDNLDFDLHLKQIISGGKKAVNKMRM